MSESEEIDARPYRAVVTGAGFIGWHLVAELLERDFELVANTRGPRALFEGMFAEDRVSETAA